MASDERGPRRRGDARGGRSRQASHGRRREARRLRWGDEAGNTLVLVPAAVLIVLGLGALALDAATLFLGQRRLADLAAAVANDAVAGIDEAAFYDAASELRLDPQRAGTRAEVLTSAQPQDRALEAVTCAVTVAGDTATAACEAQVRPLFAPLWPGMEATRTVRATETAVGRRG